MVPPLSLRLLSRDWRSGELRVLAAALALAVAAVTAVGFFTDRVRLALERQATALLGADLAIGSDHPLEQDVARLAPPALRRARTVEFPSMVMAGDQGQLASIRAVSEGYPLRGELRIAAGRFAPEAAAAGIPARGTVWLEARLLDSLGIDVGAEVAIGESSLRVAAVLVSEPASGGGMLFSLAPRLVLNLDDLGATGLVQPASRVSYRYLFAGEGAAVEAFRRAAAERLRPGERIQGVEDAQPQTRSALERARKFLALAALTSVLLAGVAVALATRRFIARHLDGCAVMRCLGAAQATILRLFAAQLLWLAAAAALAGSAAGYAAQYGLERLLGSLLQASLPAPSPRPLLLGALTALVTLLGFALPPLLHLKGVPALRVMRRELGAPPRAGLLVYAGGAAAMLALIFWQGGDPRLSLYVALGTAGALLLLGVAATLLVLLLRALRPRLGPAWRFGLLNVTRRSGAAVVQVVGFGLGLTVLLLLGVVRTDLMGAWEGSLSPDAPNRFLINIRPAQLDGVREFFRAHGLAAPDFFPMVRGRLAAIDGRPVAPADYADERAQALARREFNLSWAEGMQEDNRVVAGRWWTAAERGERVVSVEKGLADTLGIRLGDRLTFAIAGSEVEVRVSNLREVAWDSFHVNFFVIAPPGVLDDYPTSYITSLYLPRARAGVLNELVRAFPNVTVIDVAAILDQVRGLMDRASLAVQYVFAFTLAAGLLVMFAAVQATLDERIRETALLRVLGAGRARLLGMLAVEFVALGLLAGLVAASAASLLGYVLGARVFHLAYSPDWRLWLIGAAAGAMAVGVAGLLGTRPVLNSPPVLALRASD
jgi:putative ABC transport system permease protein